MDINQLFLVQIVDECQHVLLALVALGSFELGKHRIAYFGDGAGLLELLPDERGHGLHAVVHPAIHTEHDQLARHVGGHDVFAARDRGVK